MFFHHNEHDEWVNGNPDTGVAYGCGGTYLTGCSKFRVDHCIDTGSQCGLMMNRCNHGVVVDNDFSFLSALGIGMYRSSDNLISRNALDYCVRGYSHFVYSRGQDSAAILVYEQSNRNVFSYNSATRGGDGFFLWAGQSTMDTGQGGCNDNQVIGNDFSHSPANGIEATFSRNSFTGNRLVECWHGVWGGFSYSSKWAGNYLQFDDQAFAIEHGMDNEILANTIVECDEGVVLWMVPNRKPDIPYMRKRDIRSRNYLINGNLFADCVKEAVSLAETMDSKVLGDKFLNCPAKLVVTMGGKVTMGPEHIEPSRPTYLLANGNNNPAAGDLEGKFGGQGIFTEKSPHMALSPAYGRLRGKDEWGREHILVDEWGPYDYRSPVLWPVRDPSAPKADPRKVALDVFGPAGQWRLVSLTGAQLVGAANGAVPGRLNLQLLPGQAADVKAVCEFTGDGIVTPFGRKLRKGYPYRFGWSEFFAPIEWSVKWYRWDAGSDPRQPGGWERMMQTAPIASDAPIGRLAYSGGSMYKGLPPDHYGTSADGTFTVQAGTYDLKLTTDDGARVSVDGKPVITDAWHYQGPTDYHALLHLAAGRHQIHVDHFQINGYATLQVELAKP